MIKYFCDFCGEEITDAGDIQRLTSQNPVGDKKTMHFHSRKCYDAWFDKAFGNSLKSGGFDKTVKIMSKVPDDMEEMRIGSFVWHIKPYRVRKSTRSLVETQRIIACAYMYGNKIAAEKCGVKPYDVPNTLNRWGEPALKEVYNDLAYATHKIGGTTFDWRKVLALLCGGWSAKQIAEEVGASVEDVERLIAIFTGLKHGGVAVQDSE